MRLNHINLCASDVTALTDKLVAHFGYRLIDSGRSSFGPAGDFAAVVGKDGSEFVITQIDPVPEGGSAYPEGFHFGLIQDSRAAVYDKHAELVAAGLNPGDISDGFQVCGATWTAFYCPLGDGLEVEVNYRTPSALLDAPLLLA
ncbi:VOC family protein [Cryptosporangium phraense]|uniref:VOC family protein n=1 Tax=Cryptosporangium phraense TaxID=2593070 RepID=A0A545AWW6_9ACTN|nr:VOC family protein [Cryptosporangium phraense]TQS45095.1 VOC family protein [Cryptosporangium phraense]